MHPNVEIGWSDQKQGGVTGDNTVESGGASALGEGAAVTARDVRKWLIVASLFVGALVVAVQSAAHLIVTVGLGACDATGFAPCPSVFDLDHNNGVSDVISTLVIAAAAAGATVLGARRRPPELTALALAVVLILITFEDAVHVEDNLGSAYGVIVLGTIVVAALLTLCVAALTPSESRWLLLVGTALLALDAKMPFLYDQLMNTVGRPALVRGDLLYELGVVLDEAMELTGWIFLTIGLWDAALTRPRPEAADVRRGRLDEAQASAPLADELR